MPPVPPKQAKNAWAPNGTAAFGKAKTQPCQDLDNPAIHVLAWPSAFLFDRDALGVSDVSYVGTSGVDQALHELWKAEGTPSPGVHAVRYVHSECTFGREAS
jgi:hypothetical protein